MDKAEVEKELEAAETGDFSKGSVKMEQNLVANVYSNRLTKAAKSIAYAYDSTSDKLEESKRSIEAMKRPSPDQTSSVVDAKEVTTKLSTNSSMQPMDSITELSPPQAKPSLNHTFQPGIPNLLKRFKGETLQDFWSRRDKMLTSPCANHVSVAPAASKISDCMSSASPTLPATAPVSFTPKGVASNLTKGDELIERKAGESLKDYWKRKESATLATKRSVNFSSKVRKVPPARTRVSKSSLNNASKVPSSNRRRSESFLKSGPKC